MNFRPSLERYLELAADHSVIPITLTIGADRETPITAFEKLVGNRPGFLLESVEGGDRWGRWSFLGWDPAFTLWAQNGITKTDHPGMALPSGDPWQVLEKLLDRFRPPDWEGLPPLHSGAVGYLGYDTVRYVEPVGSSPPDDRQLPEMLWQFVGAMAAFDRFGQTLTLIQNVFPAGSPELEYEVAVSKLSQAFERLGTGQSYQPFSLVEDSPKLDTTSTLSREEFMAGVVKAKQHIAAGDAYQIVLSQRLETSYDGDPFQVYRALRMINPSPFLFFLRDPRVTIAGSSPELMTRVRDRVGYSRPIAGTRWRGKTEKEDRDLEAELLADPKERAEHVMLVDLARNDLGRVSEYGSVQVDDLMVVERYSHVMHIVSGVSGKLRPEVGPVDVLRATFPHGTVSGAPKIRAMQIIDDLEPVARGPYAGAVGYMDFSGNVDTAICLRTVVLANGKAWVQAGGGIVADSDPAAEYEETMNKAAAALAAIATAIIHEQIA